MPKKTEELEKLPPQNIEAEQSVLGALLIDKDAILKVADILRPGDFYKNTHATIYSAMLELYDRQEPIDILSLTNRLEERGRLEQIGGRSYLATLANSVPTASNIVNYAQIVQRKSTLRKLIQASDEMTQLAYQEEEETPKILDKAEQKLFAISQRYLKQNFIPLQDILPEAFDRIDEMHKEKGLLKGLATGFNDLDNILAGLQKSNLIILAARPSVGKSSLALDFARHAAVRSKAPVGILSLEMSKEEIVDRLLCAQAGVSLWKMRTGHLSDNPAQSDFPKIGEAMSMLSEAPIFIDDSPTASILEIRTKARKLHAEHNLGLLIVDYLQLMDAERESRVQEVSEISRGLKAIAKELRIPVLAVSQLSRAVESRTPPIPKLSDLRESGCLTGDTLITRADTGERIPIKKLAQRKKQTPFPVMAAGENWKVSPHPMIKVFPSGEKMTLELKTASGRKIKASTNHPFLRLKGWTRLDKLNIGDHIALPRTFSPQEPKNPLDKEELILLAHLLGDGCILPNQPYHYTSADKENIKIVKQTAEKLFGIKGRIVKQENWYHFYLTCPYRLARGRYHPITNWFRKLNIKRVHSWEKQMPETIFQCDREHISLFLKHLWATDGNLSPKHLPDRKPAGNIYYATSSRILAGQVQHLLMRLDIRSSLRDVPSKKYRTMYHIYVEGSTEQLKFLSTVKIAGPKKRIIPSLITALKKIIPNTNVDIIPKEAWKIFIEPAKVKVGVSWRDFQRSINSAYCGSSIFKNGLSRERMMRVYNALKTPVLHELATSDIFWDKIVSIKKLGMEEVYDATVKGAHNFVANDIIVHNSLEQDADVVLFIYREELYKKNTDKKHIADIYIAKHRSGPANKVINLYFEEETASFKNLAKEVQE